MNKKCIINCKSKNGYKFLDENKCYKELPLGRVEFNLIFGILDRCHESCSKCYGKGNDIAKNVKHPLYHLPSLNTNCVKECDKRKSL